MPQKVTIAGSWPPIYIDPDVAVVGSAATLMGLGYGKQIDRHNEVIRFNFAKIRGYEDDVGTRETIRFWSLTDERLGQIFQTDKHQMDKEIIECTRDVPILISYLHMAEIRKNGEYYGRSDNVHGLKPLVDDFNHKNGLDLDKPPRTGLIMLVSLVESGVRPHVYGFSTGTTGNRHPAHYFRKGSMVPTNGYHNVIQEEAILLEMSKRDLIILHECEVGVSKHIRRSTMKNRKEMAMELIREGDIVAELGVDWGSFSNFILENTKCGKLYSIDRWAGDRGHDDQQEADARKLLGKYGDRSEVIKATFEEALSRFADGSLDLIYIDGYAHTGQEDGKTLCDWWKKVKRGGIMSGHDYSDKWPKTKQAVNAFASRNNLNLQVTADGREYESWWFVKPE